ncbi:hypothetical protein [Bordetella ansorpii]|uniref:hypothetical protein n=1 Tax=Bordetella ansorpii TaxID=288768 RepID=UPI000A8E234F|nr:hypothetical protein [Bordetella ansorpii]
MTKTLNHSVEKNWSVLAQVLEMMRILSRGVAIRQCSANSITPSPVFLAAPNRLSGGWQAVITHPDRNHSAACCSLSDLQQKSNFWID